MLRVLILNISTDYNYTRILSLKATLSRSLDSTFLVDENEKKKREYEVKWKKYIGTRNYIETRSDSFFY